MKVQLLLKEKNQFLKPDVDFCSEIVHRSGENFQRCYHCLSCAGGCPVSDFMSYRPNGVLRLVQLGFKKKVLECADIWLCMGCNTCSIACPMAIDIAAVMHTLCELAVEGGASIAEPAILDFHREVLNSVKRYGRTHKLEIMMRYKLRKRDIFSDIDLGLQMLAKRKLDLRPSKIVRPIEIQRLFSEFLRNKR